MIKGIRIMQLDHGRTEEVEDDVVVEYPLTLYLDGTEWVTLMCSPDSLEHLAYGFLKSEGVIKGIEDIERVSIDAEKGHGWIILKNSNPLVIQLHGKRTLTSGCAKGVTFSKALDAVTLLPCQSSFRVRFDRLASLMVDFNGASKVFRATGGVHSCAVCSASEILMLKEDIGRHNAVDKLIGEALVHGVALDDKMLLTSGRISSEILIKSARAGFPIVASRSAPTDMALREAEKLGITVVGFLRGQRCNVYTETWRILYG